MTNQEITKLKKVFEQGKSTSYEINPRLFKINPLEGFHQWANNKTCKGAYLITNQYKESYWFLLSAWKEDNFYLIILDEKRTKPIIEIHQLTGAGNDQYLEWTYKPSKKDGKNEDRKLYFKKHYSTLTVSIPFPKIEDYADFVEELFLLIEIKQKSDLLDPIQSEVINSFPEGKKVERIHLIRERNRKVVGQAKSLFKQKHGRLFCEMCTFDFQERYGKLGADFIEAHHTLPLSQTEGDERLTAVEDLIMLCSNCHKMVHLHRQWLTATEIRAFFNKTT